MTRLAPRSARLSPSLSAAIAALVAAGCNPSTQPADDGGAGADMATPMVVSSFPHVASGARHSCARRDDGTVRCWGLNASGQLGDGTREDRATPTAVAGLSDVVQVVAGAAYSCALTTAGTVLCWGGNQLGQLGDGSMADHAMPAPVPALAKVTQLAGGKSHVCALLDGGSVECWGYNDFGAVGGTPGGSVRSPRKVEGITEAVVEVAAGGLHTCARLASGGAVCWGDNHSGSLGDGTEMARTSPVTVGQLGGIVQLALGDSHSCALLQDRTAWCWGFGRYGQLGDGTTAEQRLSPKRVSGLADVAEIDAGRFFTCAIVGNGGVLCFGDNNLGQLGNGTERMGRTPTPIAAITTARHLALGERHACAELTDGPIVCWGDGGRGQLGDGGGPFFRATPGAALDGVAGIVEIAVGGDHACARTGNGSVECWGSAAYGALGDGMSTQRATPVAIASLAGSTAITAGGDHTCARAGDGSMRCWGQNDAYQLGDGTRTDSSAPGDPVLPSVTAMSAGDIATCALLPDKTVSCWGLGFDGYVAHPRAVADIADAIGLTVGDDRFACALRSDGVVTCFPVDGALPSMPNTTLPPNIVEVERGGGVVCYRFQAGGVSCQGDNSNGELADGTTDRHDGLVPIAALADATQVAIGVTHLCAVHGDGTVGCWGRNDAGQLGDGTTTDRHVVTPVAGLAGVQKVGCGRSHTCALLTDGTMRCWGSFDQGQLGDGKTATRPAPAPVSP